MAESTDMGNYSDEVKEILYKRPSWVVQWGVIFIMGIFFLLLISAWMIPYPIRVNLPMTVNGSAGKIIIPDEYRELIKTNPPVFIITEGEKPGMKITISTSVVSIEKDSLTGQTIAEILLPPVISNANINQIKGKEPYFQIITRKSTLLNEIFRPFTGLFRNKIDQNK